MTTKAQETKALEQIRKIVDGLGEDSYVMTAFEGCFEIARRNIENDWSCSMKQKAEAAEKNAVEALGRAKEAKEELDRMRRTYENLCADHETLGEKYDKKEERIHDLLEDQAHLSDQLTEARNNLSDVLAQNEAMKQEIMKLKARLYDLLIANN